MKGGCTSIDNNVVVGNVGNGRQSSAANRGSVGIYWYGWPSGGTLEPNVAAQWLFDESSGDIVDEVAGLTLTKSVTSPTYGVFAPADFSNLSPGITYGANKWHIKTTAEASLDLGTSDFVIEFWFSCAADNPGEPICMRDFQGAYTGYEVLITGNLIYLELDSAAAAQLVVSVAMTGYGDGLPHKVRIVGDRSGNAQFFLDGTSLGTAAISSYVAESVPATLVAMGSRMLSTPSQFTSFNGTLYESRITIGNITNNSGGPNGG